MNWKEFLKPGWRKIILTILLFFILPFPYKFQPFCKMGIICPQRWSVGIIGLEFIHNILHQISHNYVLYITAIILAYLISCSIIYVYNKKRK